MKHSNRSPFCFLLPLSVFLVFVFSCRLEAQEVFSLWPEGEVPYQKSNRLVETEKEAWGTKCVFDITNPTLTIYPAKGEATDKAVIVIPGGGYGLVAMYHEGYDVAEELANAGITAAVLKYRLPDSVSSDTPEKVPLSDLKQAMKILQSKAAGLRFDNKKIGVMGFSAGSHLATVASVWPVTDIILKPAFSVLVYGVTMPSKANYDWLEESLYYRPMSVEEKRMQDLIAMAEENTPPTFLVHSYNDDICPVEESTLYAKKLQKVGVPVEMHLFPKGGHGFGLGRAEDGTNQWMSLCTAWIKRL